MPSGPLRGPHEEAEGLTLLKADTATGYWCVGYNPVPSKPYQARVRRGGSTVSLGYFATPKEAALCVARTPEGQKAAERAAAVLTSEEARQQAQAEGLTLLKANTATGYYGVNVDQSRKVKSYQAGVKRGGKQVSLGRFSNAEQAALCVARSPEGRAKAKKAGLGLTSEEARQQAQAEGLTLLKADNTTGYFGVCHLSGRPKPYQAQVRRGDRMVHLGSFATAEEAALCVARSPEGQAAAKKAAAAPPRTSEESDVVEMAAEVELVEAEVVHIMHNLRQAGTRTHTAHKRKRR